MPCDLTTFWQAQASNFTQTSKEALRIVQWCDSSLPAIIDFLTPNERLACEQVEQMSKQLVRGQCYTLQQMRRIRLIVDALNALCEHRVKVYEEKVAKVSKVSDQVWSCGKCTQDLGVCKCEEPKFVQRHQRHRQLPISMLNEN